MNKATTSTADRRTQQAGDGVRAAASTHYIEKPPGPVHVPDVGQPGDGRDHLYNVDGHLFWNGVDLTNLSDSSSKWMQAGGEAGAPIYHVGRVGVGTAQPSSELDVAGTITARGLRLQTLDGVAKVARGEIVGNAVLDDMADVSAASAEPGRILVRGDAGWVAVDPRDAIVLEHSSMDGLDADDHGHYLNAERHSATPHSVPSLSVADGALVASKDEVKVDAPLVVRGGLSMVGTSGILIARRGRISADATSDDIPEGETSRYHSPDRVAEVGDRRYLMLDGSNTASLRPSGATISGLDADSVDGKHAADFSSASHDHAHSELSSIGEDDHHARLHPLNGSDHSVPPGIPAGSVLVVLPGGGIGFSTIDVGSTTGTIPLSRIGSGLVKPGEMESLLGVREPIQAQIDRKCDATHAHRHADAEDLDSDQHGQYLTVERADEWLGQKSTDDIRQGGRNRYVDPSEIISIVDARHLRLDGGNVPKGTIVGLDADSVDGVQASDMSRVGHQHDHGSLNGVGRDDHHPEVHDIESHVAGRGVPPEAIMKVKDGRPTFERISADDLPFPVASADSVATLTDRVGRHDVALRSKADASHGHSHSSIGQLDADDHKQYLTVERAGTFVSGLTTDVLREGRDNRYFRPESARAAVSPLTPLGYDGDRLTLRIDERYLQIVGDRLTLRNPVDDSSSLSVKSLTVGNGKLSATNSEGIVRVGDEEEPTDLVVTGKVTARAFVLSSGDGVVHAAGGTLSSGAGIDMMSDVSVESPSSGDLLSFDGLFWRNTSVADIVASIKGKDPLDEGDVKDIHRSLPHDVPSLMVGQGVFSVNPIKGTVAINTPVAKNALDVNGGIAVGRDLAGVVDVNPGTIVASGSVGIGSGVTPRQALDTWSGLIVGGTHSESRPNVLNLSSTTDAPTSSIAFHGGGSVEVSASDVSAMLRLNTRSWGSLLLAHNPNDGTLIAIPQDGRLSVKIGQQEVASFGENGVAVGVRDPRMRLDVRGHVGVSDGSANPKSWMLLRAAVPEAPPTICFPSGGELQVGTLKSYDAGAVWDATASFESDGTFRVSGRVIQGITRIKLDGGQNEDLPIGAFGVVKVSADSPASIGGVSGGFNGAVVVLVNTGAFPISIVDECVGSMRENRISAGVGTELGPKKCMTMVYDGDTDRWIPSI